MLTLLKSIVQSEFAAECGRLLLLSISVSYVGANMRRLATRYGWDQHLLYLVYFAGRMRRGPARNLPGGGSAPDLEGRDGHRDHGGGAAAGG